MRFGKCPTKATRKSEEARRLRKRCRPLWQKASSSSRASASGCHSSAHCVDKGEMLQTYAQKEGSWDSASSQIHGTLQICCGALTGAVYPRRKKHLISGMPLPAAKTSTKQTRMPAMAAEPQANRFLRVAGHGAPAHTCSRRAKEASLSRSAKPQRQKLTSNKYCRPIESVFSPTQSMSLIFSCESGSANSYVG